MKALLSICTLFISSFVFAAEMPPAAAPSPGVVKGEVLEVQNAANFTYLRLKTGSGEVWAAVVSAPVKTGAEVTIENPVLMRNFESKGLKRTFPEIIFGNLAGAAGAPSGMGMGGGAANPHGASGGSLGTAYPMMPKKKLETINQTEVIAKAKGQNARTVAEVYQQAAKLKGKTVAVRGKVVKYNPDIMGKNWVHLRDGSGSAADGTDDLLVTINGAPPQIKIGQVVTARGVVRTDADFGAGYAYKVLLEEATVK